MESSVNVHAECCLMFQKLRQSFAENELPSRDVKRRISELVGLEYKKVRPQVLHTPSKSKNFDITYQNLKIMFRMYHLMPI